MAEPAGEQEHATYASGELQATPDCPCDHCRAVFEEWTEQAIGFQRWFGSLDDFHLRHYFGLTREAAETARSGESS